MKSNTTYYTDDWKEKLVDDFYTEYYPNPRLEQSIFKYLDDLYYISEDEVFDTIYRKSDDYFIGKTQITEDLQNLFGLTLPTLLKIGPGEEDYIEPARNPIPRRVLNNWIKSKKESQSINENKESKINPQLMIGDEITVVHVDESFGTLNTPERYKDYVVIGRRHRQPENWEGPDADTSYYVIEPLSGYSDKETLGRMLAGGGRKREEQLHSTDRWMLRKGFLRGEHLTEQKSLKDNLFNVELEEGDTILVVNRSEAPPGVREPFPEHEPELFVPYVVISVKDTGHKAKHPYHYFLLPEEQYEISINDPYDDSVDKSVKSLFPWIHDWILDKEEDIITEHKESKINPFLDKGDIIRVIDISGEHSRMPDRFGLYKVLEIKQDNATQEFYYDIEPYPYTHHLTPMKTLYHGDTWIYGEIPMATKVDRKTISEQKESKINPELEVGDTIRVIDVDGEHDRKPEKFKLYRVAYKGNKPIGHVTSSQRMGIRIWYDIVPTDLDYDTVRTFDSRGTPMYHSKSLYPGDTWIKTDEVISEQVHRNLNPDIQRGDVIMVLDVVDLNTQHTPTGEGMENTALVSGDGVPRYQLFGAQSIPQTYHPYVVMFRRVSTPVTKEEFWQIWPVDEEGKLDRGNIEISSPHVLSSLDTWKMIKPYEGPGDEKMPEEDYGKDGGDGFNYQDDYYSWTDEKSINEQSADSPGDNISDDDEEYVDNTPFTKKEILILNQLHKKLTKEELQYLVNDTPGRGTSDYYQHQTKFWEVMKLFGMDFKHDIPYQTRISQYAKWALDNWTPEGDYGKIGNPLKMPLKWYKVSREETGTQVEYKAGEVEVLGFDYDNAEERGNNEFWEWGGEMETDDYGDYDTHDSEITGVDFVRLDEAKRIVKVLNEQDESGLKRQITQAETEDFQELMYEVLRRVRQIPLDKTVSPRRIKEILSDDGVSFDLYQGADLNEEIHREYNRVRFYEYSQQLLKAAHSKGVRGHYFEGLLAGLFNGEVVSPMEGEMTDPKEDVLINGINYSAKLVRAQDKKWGTSSLLGGFKKAIIQRLVDRDIEVSDELLKRKLEIKSLNELIGLFPEGDPDRDSFQVRHMELFLKDSSVDRKYKEITMDYAFTSKSEEEIGIELHWIFGLIWGTNESFEGEELPTTNLKYYLMDTPSLIDGILDGDIHFTKGRNIREIRISEKSMVDSNGATEHSIIFPMVTRQDLKNLLYDEESENMVYKVMGIFKDFRPGTEKYMHHKIADVIADNPQEFIKKLQDLFPEKKITNETVSKILENIDPEIKYAIDQQYRTNPEMRDEILKSLEDEGDGKYYLNPEGSYLNVPPIKIAQKFSDVNGYGKIKFDMQGGNGIAYFTDKDLVIKLTTDDSEYFTANKLVGTDNEYIVKVLESARIKTSHSKGDLFIIVQESLPMTKEMEKTWDECCCGLESPIHIDYLKEPSLVLPPVSEQEKCIPIYDEIIAIQKNFAEYGIVWSDIGIDNLGIKNGHLAVIDLGETKGGETKGEEMILNLENIKIRPLTEKHIRKQLHLI